MTRRCSVCSARLASDNPESWCTPCDRAYEELTVRFARWVLRFTNDEVGSMIFAETLMSSISADGQDGEDARRLLRRTLDDRRDRARRNRLRDARGARYSSIHPQHHRDARDA